MKRNWFLYFFRKSVSQRKGRVVTASLSVMLAVAVVTGLAGITSGIQGKLGSELKAYGANLIVSSGSGGYLDYDALKLILELDGVEYASGQIFGRAFMKTESVEIIGLDTGRIRESGWRLSGNWPGNDREIIAGINLKKALTLDTGQAVVLSTGNKYNPPVSPLAKGGIEGEKKYEFNISGFIERGGAEDNAFIVSLSQAWQLTGAEEKLSAVLVRGMPGELENISSKIENTVPDARVKTLRQVAVAEESLLRKIQLLMMMVTVVVLFAAMVSVVSTMGANVLERREEIGLMKAIGATRNNIRSFYVAEAVLIGTAGGAVGFLLGYLFAQAVSWGAFSSFIGVPFCLPVLSVVSGLLISLAASHFPVGDALKYNPAVILREE